MFHSYIIVYNLNEIDTVGCIDYYLDDINFIVQIIPKLISYVGEEKEFILYTYYDPIDKQGVVLQMTGSRKIYYFLLSDIDEIFDKYNLNKKYEYQIYKLLKYRYKFIKSYIKNICSH